MASECCDVFHAAYSVAWHVAHLAEPTKPGCAARAASRLRQRTAMTSVTLAASTTPTRTLGHLRIADGMANS
jgi:hypothetical protein